MAPNADDMYGRVEWMVPADEAILRLLAAPKKLELTPGDIAHNIGYGRGHVQERLGELTDHGLVVRQKQEGKTSRYGVTELGQGVVDQEVTADELNDL